MMSRYLRVQPRVKTGKTRHSTNLAFGCLWLIDMHSRTIGFIVAIACVSCRAEPALKMVHRVERKDQSFIVDIAISSDQGQLATIQEGGTLEIWDTTSFRLTKTIENAGDGRSIAFWDGERIAATWGSNEFDDDSSVVIWDLKTESLIAKLPVAVLVEPSCLFVSERPLMLTSGATQTRGGYEIKQEPSRLDRITETIEVWTEDDIARFVTNDIHKYSGHDADIFHPMKEISECSDDTNWLAVDPDGIHLIAVGENHEGGVVTRFDITNGALL